MSFSIHFYTDTPVMLLDCPQPLDFERGLDAAQDEITLLLEQTQHVYLMVDVHDIGVFGDVFAERMTSWDNHRVTTMVIADSGTTVAQPCFASIDEALDYCYAEGLRAAGD